LYKVHVVCWPLHSAILTFLSVICGYTGHSVTGSCQMTSLTPTI
jgi:hypothetical protein